MVTQTNLEAHQYYHFEDLQQSAKDFYASIEALIKERTFPNVECERVSFSEGGVLSAGREYLRISRKEYKFYVCAAPFGKSFLVSWWLKEDISTFTALLEYIPFIGKYLVRNANRKTFYQIDTELIFKESIKSVVDSVVKAVSTAKGIRIESQQYVA